MNGEEHDKLITLETETKVRWDSHDKRSEEIWGQIQGQIKAIFQKIDGLQCQTHAEKHRGINKQIAWLWSFNCPDTFKLFRWVYLFIEEYMKNCVLFLACKNNDKCSRCRFYNKWKMK